MASKKLAAHVRDKRASRGYGELLVLIASLRRPSAHRHSRSISMLSNQRGEHMRGYDRVSVGMSCSPGKNIALSIKAAASMVSMSEFVRRAKRIEAYDMLIWCPLFDRSCQFCRTPMSAVARLPRPRVFHFHFWRSLHLHSLQLQPSFTSFPSFPTHYFTDATMAPRRKRSAASEHATPKVQKEGQDRRAACHIASDANPQVL